MVDIPPQVILIAGPNGAGKSTLAPYLLRDTLGLTEFVNADTIALGLSAYNPNTVAVEAGRIMLKRLRVLAAQRASFAFESTLASRTYAPWLDGLKQTGYKFQLLYLWLRSPELAEQRVNERVQAGGHDVPRDVIRRRYYKGLRNFFHLYQSLADSWGIYDNSISGESVMVAKGSGLNIRKILQAETWQEFVKQAHETSS